MQTTGNDFRLQRSKVDAHFGDPPLAAQNEALIKERLEVAMRSDGAKVTVDWRGDQQHLRVISMPVEMLYFNPDTHRIRAQRTMDPERNRQLDVIPGQVVNA